MGSENQLHLLGAFQTRHAAKGHFGRWHWFRALAASARPALGQLRLKDTLHIHAKLALQLVVTRSEQVIVDAALLVNGS